MSRFGLFAVAVSGVLPFLRANWPGAAPAGGPHPAEAEEEDCFWDNPGCGGPAAPAAGASRAPSPAVVPEEDAVPPRPGSRPRAGVDRPPPALGLSPPGPGGSSDQGWRRWPYECRAGMLGAGRRPQRFWGSAAGASRAPSHAAALEEDAVPLRAGSPPRAGAGRPPSAPGPPPDGAFRSQAPAAASWHKRLV